MRIGEDLDLDVRAYDTSTGVPVFEDRIDRGAEDVGNAVAIRGQLLFVGGRVTNLQGDVDLFVRAYALR